MIKKRGYTILEIIVVLVILGILSSFFFTSGFFQNQKNKIYLARDMLISLIRSTEEKALDNDNYKLFYNVTSLKDELLTKYYFKNFYHIKIFKDTDGQIKVIVFKDEPNFDNDIKNNYKEELVKNSNGLYLSGKCGTNGYPTCSSCLKTLNLTKYFGIVSIEDDNNKSNINLLFDRFGNIFLNEGLLGADAGDIYVYDSVNRPIVNNYYDLYLKDKLGDCLGIRIYKYGFIKKINCK